MSVLEMCEADQEGSFLRQRPVSSLDRSRNLRDKTCDSQAVYHHLHCTTLVAGKLSKYFRKNREEVGRDQKLVSCEGNIEYSVVYSLTLILLSKLSCSLPKDLYYDEDASDKDKKDEDAAKRKANRPSE